MNSKDILTIAMQQSAIDSHCSAADFLSHEPKVVLSQKNAQARKYLELPFSCDLTSYGNNVVASVSAELQDMVTMYLAKFAPEHCFETPNLHVLMEQLRPLGLNVCFMAEYFLPDLDAPQTPDCQFETRLMQPDEFQPYYLPEWANALCERRKELDCLAVGAFDGPRLIGLAGCSADCDTMWQIGIDVLPEYRKQGIASCLTNKLMQAVLERGIVPFYCCAWSNIKSVRNAIKSGFKPAWVQATVKPIAMIETMNI